MYERPRSPPALLQVGGVLALTRAREPATKRACARPAPANSVARTQRRQIHARFIPHDLEAAKVLGNLVYRPNVVEVEGNYDDVNRLCSEIAGEQRWAFVNVNIRPYYAEGSKTLAYEVVEQLDWTAPDQIVVPMASGSLLTRYEGIKRIAKAGLGYGHAHARPRGAGRGCSRLPPPTRRRDFFKPVKPKTIAKSLASAIPPTAICVEAAAESGGAMDTVTDEEIVEGMTLLAQTEGIFAETAGGVTVGVLKKLAKQGIIKRGDVTVALITGNGLKTQDAVINAVGRPTRIPPSLVAFQKTFNLTPHG